MDLTVLGCYGPYPPAGGSCSGYLVQEDDYNILIDCGNGVLSRLQKHIDFRKLDAVLLSHLHADHFADILIMRYGLEAAYRQGLRKAPLDLYSLPKPASEYEMLPYKNAYNVIQLEPEQEQAIGPFKIETTLGVHTIPSLAIRVKTTSSDFVYSGDTEYWDGLIEFARNTQLLLCEANYQDLDIPGNLPNHLSASQAAQVAAGSGAVRLLLTHLNPERDTSVSLREARKIYPEAELAREGKTYNI